MNRRENLKLDKEIEADDRVNRKAEEALKMKWQKAAAIKNKEQAARDKKKTCWIRLPGGCKKALTEKTGSGKEWFNATSELSNIYKGVYQPPKDRCGPLFRGALCPKEKPICNTFKVNRCQAKPLPKTWFLTKKFDYKGPIDPNAMLHKGEPCENHCNAQGPCAWCGIGFCCKKNYWDKSGGCDNNFNFTKKSELAEDKAIPRSFGEPLLAQQQQMATFKYGTADHQCVAPVTAAHVAYAKADKAKIYTGPS